MLLQIKELKICEVKLRFHSYILCKGIVQLKKNSDPFYQTSLPPLPFPPFFSHLPLSFLLLPATPLSAPFKQNRCKDLGMEELTFKETDDYMNDLNKQENNDFSLG